MKSTSGFSMETRCQLAFDDCITKVEESLQHQGFGVLTRIDVRDTLHAKLGIDTQPYVILGACNPPFAHQVLEIEPLIGVLLPCNVVVMEEGESRRVAAMDPGFMSQVMDHPELAVIAREVKSLEAQADGEPCGPKQSV
jgi:uncharacterized protein (DUF302 family)